MVRNVPASPPSSDNDDPSDSDLVARIQGGDERAMEILYRRYYSHLFRFAYSMVRARAITEEIVQDTFLAFWNRRESLSTHGNIRAYLYSTTRNRVLHHIEHQRIVDRTQAEAARENLPLAMSSAEVGADITIEADELAAYVARAIAAMPERRRLALTLRWRHGMSYAEIAEVLGTTVGAVTTQIARVKESIEALIEAYKSGQR